MPAFAYRILPPRANFVATITDGEAATMGAHFGFLQGLEAEGRTVVVPWGASLDEVRKAVERLVELSGVSWTRI